MLIRKAAGVVLIAGGTGLAAISGVLAYFGFEEMIKIPFAGWIGPCVALSLIALGIAVESEIRHRRYVAAGILFVLLVCGGLLDRHSGELALVQTIENAKQLSSDRNQKFSTAEKTKKTLEDNIAKWENELVIMTGDGNKDGKNDHEDIKLAQVTLTALGLYTDEAGKPMPIDGIRGSRTLVAMADRGKELRADLAKAREDLKKETETVSAGASNFEVPFSLHDAALYATVITVLAIVFAFAGSYVYAGFEKEENVDELLDDMEDAVASTEDQIVELAQFLGTTPKQRERMRKKKRA